jgi:hypothetical protein
LLGCFDGLQFDTCPLSESFDGLGEPEVFPHLQKGEDAAAGPAGEAFEDLFGGIDIQAGPVVIVEGAQANHFPALFGKADMLADDISDVISLEDLVYRCSIKHARHN